MGAGEDLQLFHDGSSSRINASNGALVIQAVTQHDIVLSHAGEDCVRCKPDGAVELSHDGTKRFETITKGAAITGGLSIDGGSLDQASGQDATLYVTASSNADWGILLNKANNEYGMRINTPASSVLAFAIYDNSNVQKFAIKGSGDVVAVGTVDSTSDIKLKTNIKTIDNALDKVLQLRGAEYDRIDKGQHEVGVIAQEVEKVIPEVVHGDETKSVAYGNMVAVLIEAIKEQNEIINKMKKEIEDLKG